MSEAQKNVTEQLMVEEKKQEEWCDKMVTGVGAVNKIYLFIYLFNPLSHLTLFSSKSGL